MNNFTDIQTAALLAQARALILSDAEFDCAVHPLVLAQQIEALIETILSTNKGE